MPLLTDHQWKAVYRTGDDDLYHHFYKNALTATTNYDRAVGYFSSEMLAYTAKGLSNLIRNNGTMRLIIGNPVDHDEYEAIQDGKKLRELDVDVTEKLIHAISTIDEPLAKTRIHLLCWMIACGSLEIKFAFRKRGMYHEKIGILVDKEGNRLVFQGSANETKNAISIDLNYESIAVYPSWRKDIYDAYGLPYVEGFRRLWDNRQLDTVVLPLPNKAYDALIQFAEQRGLPDVTAEDRIEEDYSVLYLKANEPRIPKTLGGKNFSIKPHQASALRKWNAAGRNGILKLATGSGKTITAIYGSVKLLEAASPPRLFLVVAVPYQNLADQWIQSLKIFGIHAHRCYESKESWMSRFALDVDAYIAKAVNFVAVVVVNNTLKSAPFQSIIKKVDGGSLLFVGDECHNHGSTAISAKLPAASMRLGLSATPFNSDEEEIDNIFPNEAKRRIIDFYGDIVAEYSLEDAINDRVLCPYNYYVHAVYLTDEETAEYVKFSDRISALFKKKQSGRVTSEESESLTRLIAQRTRLLGSAQDKLTKLRLLLSDKKRRPAIHTLFYCGEGSFVDPDDGLQKKFIDKVSKILGDFGWKSCQFTARENRTQRQHILSDFRRGDIDALVSMRVLDEGIDIPACERAFILASTRNVRQFVQRRGRILRVAEGKTRASIYDLFLMPNSDNEDNPALSRLQRSELNRVFEFLSLADNKADVLSDLKNFGIEL